MDVFWSGEGLLSARRESPGNSQFIFHILLYRTVQVFLQLPQSRQNEQVEIENELIVAVSQLHPQFEKICSTKQSPHPRLKGCRGSRRVILGEKMLLRFFFFFPGS